MDKETSEMEKKIGLFWGKFEKISKKLFSTPNDKTTIELLDRYLADLSGKVEWEIGPLGEKMFLAISPCLNIDNFRFTKNVISQSPMMENWVFYPYKPAKEWIDKLYMKNEWDEDILVNTSNWEYILYLFDDGMYEIDVFIEGIDGDSNTYERAVEIVLTNVLGEDIYITKISGVKIITERPDSNENHWKRLKFLKPIDLYSDKT